MEFIKLADAATSTTAQNGTGNTLSMILMFVVIIGVFYFLMIRPQKKRQKEEQQMRDNLTVGDEITSIGGICGKVVSIKDDSIIVESSADHSKIKLMRWAIQSNNTATAAAESEKKAAAQQRTQQKTEKKTEKKEK